MPPAGDPGLPPSHWAASNRNTKDDRTIGGLQVGDESARSHRHSLVRLIEWTEVQISPYKDYICLDMDTFVMDQSGTKK